MSQLAVSSDITYFSIAGGTTQVFFTESRRVDGIGVRGDSIASIIILKDNDDNVYGYLMGRVWTSLNTSWLAINGLKITTNRASNIIVTHSAAGV